MVHAFIDTNIFVRVATQGRPGCEQNHFTDLRTLVEEGVFRLLVPEVVSLEVEKTFRSLSKSVESACDSLCDAVGKAAQNTWSEIDSLKVEVLNRIREFKKSKAEECCGVSSKISEFLQSDAVTRITLSPEIMVAAKRRHIAGMMPNCRKSSDQDALIIESLVSFFTGHSAPDTAFLFCSENTSDFALEVKDENLDKRYVLDPSIQVALPPARFSTDLASMLRIIQGYEELPAPTNEEIEHAVNMRDLHDVEDEEFQVFDQIVMDAVHRESTKQFQEDVLPSVPEDVRMVRDRLSSQVAALLAECRNCTSWGERSEYKLPQWIEYVDEPMIPYTSLPKLLRIKNSLEKYLEVHRQMDGDGIVGDS